MKIFIDNCITIKNRGSELWKVVNNKGGFERKGRIGSCLSHHAQRIIRCMLYVCCAIFFLHWFSYINLWYTIPRTSHNPSAARSAAFPLTPWRYLWTTSSCFSSALPSWPLAYGCMVNESVILWYQNVEIGSSGLPVLILYKQENYITVALGDAVQVKWRNKC